MKARKEALIEQKLKKEDPFEFPMDDLFFDQMHDKIMKAVSETEIKPQTKWTKTWIFLETQSRPYWPTPPRIVKSALMLGFASLSLGFGSLGLVLFQQTHDQQASKNQQKILTTVANVPSDWIELAEVSEKDGDVYAELLNERIEQLGLEAQSTLKDL